MGPYPWSRHIAVLLEPIMRLKLNSLVTGVRFYVEISACKNLVRDSAREGRAGPDSTVVEMLTEATDRTFVVAPPATQSAGHFLDNFQSFPLFVIKVSRNEHLESLLDCGRNGTPEPPSRRGSRMIWTPHLQVTVSNAWK